VAGDDKGEIQILKLDATFKIKDFREARYFLSMTIPPIASGLAFTQRKFNKELLEEFGGKDVAFVIYP